MLSELSYKEMEYLVEEYIHNGRNRAIILRKLHNEEITYEKLAEMKMCHEMCHEFKRIA